jgi:hypothetical protein
LDHENQDQISRLKTRLRLRRADPRETIMVWTGEAQNGYCPHGEVICPGDPDKGLAGCGPGDYHYCGHGFDARLTTSDGQPRCSFCRGVSREQRNRETFSRRRVAAAPPVTYR